MKVRFNQVEEFCTELEKDAPYIDRGIVRCSNLFEVANISSNIHRVSFIATYSVGGGIVELRHYCGNTWRPNQEADNKVLDKAKQISKTIEEVCQRLNLEVRAGCIEEDK